MAEPKDGVVQELKIIVIANEQVCECGNLDIAIPENLRLLRPPFGGLAMTGVVEKSVSTKSFFGRLSDFGGVAISSLQS